MPLSFDLPLDKLKSYQGSTPCPNDFDSFWDKSLNEISSIDPNVELIPAKFQSPYAECFNMFYTSTRNARIHAKLIKPKGNIKPSPAILWFHGYGAHSWSWFEKLPYAAMGYTVAAMDCRGQGGLSTDTGNNIGNTLNGHIIRGLDGPPEHMLYRNIFLDTVQLANIVKSMPEVDATRLGVHGGSQGGGLALACASLVSEIKLAAPYYPFLSDYKRVWQMDLAENAYRELKDYFRLFDPTHTREEEIFTKLGYIDIQNLTGRIKAKVLMGIGLMDTICPPSTQFAAYNKIKSEKSMAIYPDFGHEELHGFIDKVFDFFKEL